MPIPFGTAFKRAAVRTVILPLTLSAARIALVALSRIGG